MKNKKNIIFADTNQRLVDYISFVLALLTSILMLYLVTFLPLESDFEEVTRHVLPKLLESCRPEPFEMLQYAITVVTLPLSYLFFNSLISKRIRISPEKAQYLYNLMQAGLIFAVVILSFSVYFLMYDFFNIPHYAGNGEFYRFLRINRVGYCFLVEAVTIAIMLIIKKINSQKFEKILFWIMAIAVITYCGICTARIRHIYNSEEYNLHHFYAFWYPIYKVFSGKTPGIDFENIYGLYAYFTVPVLKALGGVSQKSISIYLSILLCYNVACYYAFCYKFISNKAFAAFVATVGSVYGAFTVLSNSFYYQYYPLRTIFLATAMLGVTIYLSIKNAKLRTAFNVFMFVILGLGIAWNIESGMVAVIFWIAFILFNVVYDKGLKKDFIVTVIKALLGALLSIIVFLAFAEGVTYLRSGAFIGKDELLFGIFAFEGTGFYMIPLLFGAWVIVALLYATNLLLSIGFLLKGKRDDLTKTEYLGLFLSAVAGIGAFSYFVGRSYPTNIFMHSAVICIAAGILVEFYFNRISRRISEGPFLKRFFRDKNTIDTLKIVLVFFLLSLFMFLSLSRISVSLTDNGREALYSTQNERFNSATSEIKKWSDEENNGELPNLLVYYSIYFDELLDKKANEDVCEQIDWFYDYNVYTYIEFINEHKDESFAIDKSAVDEIMQLYPVEYAKALKGFELSEEIEYKEHKNQKICDSYIDIYSPIQ